jgi:hypothetical protein
LGSLVDVWERVAFRPAVKTGLTLRTDALERLHAAMPHPDL